MGSCHVYCAELVREQDPDRYLATLFAPAGAREHLYAFYAFNCEITRVRDLVSDPLPGEVRLQWWRDLLNGEGETGNHPVAQALLESCSGSALDPGALCDLIEARICDLYDDPMPDLDSFRAYCRDTSASMMVIAANLLEADPDQASQAIDHAGIAYAVTGILRSLPFHAGRGQVLLPADRMEANGVSREDIVEGRTDENIHALLAEMRAVARIHAEGAGKLISALPSSLAPALLPVALVRHYLDRMDHRGYDPFRTPVELPQWRRQWILWRAARRAIPG